MRKVFKYMLSWVKEQQFLTSQEIKMKIKKLKQVRIKNSRLHKAVRVCCDENWECNDIKELVSWSLKTASNLTEFSSLLTVLLLNKVK